MSYGINDIESLSFRDGVRQRIQMYLGSNDNQGAYNGIQEIISNSIDEYYMGFGNEIRIDIDENENAITISDDGRGIPFGIKDDGSNVLVDIFSRPHTGGKFNDKVYNSVAGLNGIGAKATCLSSTFFDVVVTRDNKKAHALFKEGRLEDYNEEPFDSNKTGTTIHFSPDPEVFNLEALEIKFDRICDICKNLSYLTKGLKFIVTCNGITRTYCAKDGLIDLVRDQAKDAIHATPAYFYLADGNTTCEVALQWTKGPERWFVFTNGIPQIEGGTSLTGMKTAITRFMKAQLGSEFNGDTARAGLVYAVACKTPKPSFANQVKSKINNPELNGLAQKATSSALAEMAEKRAGEFKVVSELLTKMRKAEQAAERAKNAILRATKEIETTAKRKVFSSDKLKDAKKLGQDSILLICEGKSAVGSLAQGRDPDKYGLLEIRGKIINCLSNSLDKVMENEEVKLIFSALGVTPNNYKASKLRYGKVGIATDADKDGNHIALLLLSFFSEMLPEMLKEGRVARLDAPTHGVKVGTKMHYFYSDEDFQNRKINGEVVMFKGLGEMSGPQVKETMFGPNQHMTEFKWTAETDELLRQFMGTDIEPRRDFLFNKVDFSTIVE